MAKQLVRTRTADQNAPSFFNGIVTTRWERPDDGKSVKEIHTTLDPVALGKTPGVKESVQPPLHWHWYQDEYFHVRKGRYVFQLDGKQIVSGHDDPQPVFIPARAFHTFCPDVTYTDGPCQVEISTVVSPRAVSGKAEESGMNEKIFRNMYTYIADCHQQGVPLSLPQMLLFLHTAEVSLAFPGPAWLMRPISYAFGLVVGVGLGQWVLGLKPSYPEYWDEKKSR